MTASTTFVRLIVQRRVAFGREIIAIEQLTVGSKHVHVVKKS
jgi:hypothetical protein